MVGCYCPQTHLYQGNAGDCARCPLGSVLTKSPVQIHQYRFSVVRHWDRYSCTFTSAVGTMESFQAQPCLYMCPPTKFAAATMGPTPAVGALITHPEVHQVLSSQIGHWWCKSGSQLLGIGSDFSPASACGQPTIACTLEPCLQWACWKWDRMVGPCPSFYTCVNDRASLMDQGPSHLHPWLLLGPYSRPFRLFPWSHPEYSPLVSLLKLRFLHTSRLAPQTGERRKVARTVCACLSPFCLRQSGCYTLLWASEAPNLSCLSSQALKGVPKVRETFLFHSSPSGMLVPYQSFAFFFHPTWLHCNL